MMAVSQPSEKPEVQEGPANDPEKATDYWGKKFAKNPRDLKSALNYARNLKAMGQKRRAIIVLQHTAAAAALVLSVGLGSAEAGKSEAVQNLSNGLGSAIRASVRR